MEYQNKTNKGVLIGSIAAGAAIAGGLAWLFFTDKGKEVKDGLIVMVKDRVADALAAQLDRRTALSQEDAAGAAGTIVG